MKPLTIRNTVLGTNRPKIAVPLTGKDQASILKQATDAKTLADIIEWRIDFFSDVLDFEVLSQVAKKLRDQLDQIPLLITFRTAKEGGVLELSEDQYFEICKYVVENNLADLIDVELFSTTAKVKALIALANKKDVKVIMSNHDFNKTPNIAEIVRRLQLMASYGADIVKIAVMPNSATDVLNLLSATQEVSDRLSQPVISMAMGDLGKATRVCGEAFGSCLTFGTVGQASAPGQIEANRLKDMMDALKLS